MKNRQTFRLSNGELAMNQMQEQHNKQEQVKKLQRRGFGYFKKVI